MLLSPKPFKAPVCQLNSRFITNYNYIIISNSYSSCKAQHHTFYRSSSHHTSLGINFLSPTPVFEVYLFKKGMKKTNMLTVNFSLPRKCKSMRGVRFIACSHKADYCSGRTCTLTVGSSVESLHSHCEPLWRFTRSIAYPGFPFFVDGSFLLLTILISGPFAYHKMWLTCNR